MSGCDQPVYIYLQRFCPQQVTITFRSFCTFLYLYNLWTCTEYCYLQFIYIYFFGTRLYSCLFLSQLNMCIIHKSLCVCGLFSLYCVLCVSVFCLFCIDYIFLFVSEFCRGSLKNKTKNDKTGRWKSSKHPFSSPPIYFKTLSSKHTIHNLNIVGIQIYKHSLPNLIKNTLILNQLHTKGRNKACCWRKLLY